MFGWQENRLKERCVQLEERTVILGDRIIDLTNEKDELEDSVSTLSADNTQLKQKRKMEDEMIAHKLKMREEQVAIDSTKKIAAAERAADERVAGVKDTYRDKIEKQLEKRGDELKKMYTEILARLPDVNLAIKQTNK